MSDEHFDDLDAPWHGRRDALYDRVVQRGRWLQWRRRALVASVLAVVFIVPTSAIAASRQSHPVTVFGLTLGHEAAPATTTTTAAPPTTVRHVVPPPRRTTTTTVAGGTTTTIAGCHNSTDPKCGAFSLTTPPPTDPLLVYDSYTPSTPVNGEPVTLAVRAVDGTATLVVDWGDGTIDRSATQFSPSCQPPTGLWSLPFITLNPVTPTPTHTYATPGAYTVHIEASVCGIYTHLQGTTTADILITVGDASATTTTTTTIATPPSS